MATRLSMRAAHGRRGIRRCTSVLVSGALVTLGAVVVTTVSVPAAQASPASTKVVNYTGTLATSGQSMWGPGNAAPPADQVTPLFDQSWNASGGFDQETDVSFDPCFGVLGGCTVDFGTYGAKFTASTSGEIGLSGVVHGASGGTVGVNYPVSFNLTAPADDSFAPGDTVAVSTTAPTVTAGASISSVYPDFSSVGIDGTFGYHASANGEFCVGGCTGGSIFDVNVPDAGSTTGSILSVSKSDLTLIQGLGLSRCFGIAEGLLFGASTYPNAGNFCEDTVTHQDKGYLAFPDVTLGAATIGADNSLSAGGTDQFMVVPISAVAWAAKLADLPYGFPNLSATFDGTGVAYTTINDILTAVVTEHQDITFSPTVNLTLDFGQSIGYSVKDSSNNVLLTGTGSNATFPLGDKISFAPPNALTISPTLTIGKNTITNHTWDTLTGTNQVQALSLSASIGGCCDGAFGGIDVNLGPVYDSGLQTIGEGVVQTRSNSRWTLGGFNAAQLAPFTISPDPVPVPTAKTVTPVEGATFTGVIASFHDPDPAAANVAAADDQSAVIDWGDGTSTTNGSLTGTGASYSVTGTHTYAEEGTFRVSVTVTDTDTPTVHATAASTANVSDAALHITAQPALSSTEGAPTSAGLVVTKFTDDDPAGTVGDYTATIDWGDGTAHSVGTVSAGTSGDFVVAAPRHTYAEEGTPTVTVTVSDQGGASAVAHPPMATADAALHSTGLTNGTLSGSSTPVLYWPAGGNAVLAHVTDDDPLGMPSDYTAVVHWGDGTQSDAVVSNAAGGGFSVTGNHTYSNANLGVHTVTIDVSDEGGATTHTSTTVLAYGFASGGTFAIGDRTLSALSPSFTVPVTFWGSSWYKTDVLSGGAAPSSFKGYVSNPPANPTPPAFLPTATNWTTLTGSSSLPPATVPAYMLVLVTGQVTQTSSTVASGSVVHWVIVKTNSGYGPTAGQTGTGTVVAVLG